MAIPGETTIPTGFNYTWGPDPVYAPKQRVDAQQVIRDLMAKWVPNFDWATVRSLANPGSTVTPLNTLLSLQAAMQRQMGANYRTSPDWLKLQQDISFVSQNPAGVVAAPAQYVTPAAPATPPLSPIGTVPGTVPIQPVTPPTTPPGTVTPPAPTIPPVSAAPSGTTVNPLPPNPVPNLASPTLPWAADWATGYPASNVNPNVWAGLSDAQVQRALAYYTQLLPYQELADSTRRWQSEMDWKKQVDAYGTTGRARLPATRMVRRA